MRHIYGVEELLSRGKKLTISDFKYNEPENRYECPNGKKLEEVLAGQYECKECIGCRLASLCKKGEGGRKIKRSSFAEMLDRMRKKLLVNPGMMKERRKVERIFSLTKWNRGYTRFRRKGLEGAKVVIDLLVMAINIQIILQIGDRYLLPIGNNAVPFFVLFYILLKIRKISFLIRSKLKINLS